MLRALSYKFIPGSCHLCTLPSKRDFDLCLHCEAALPTNEHACLTCALPQDVLFPRHGVCADCTLSPSPLALAYAGFVYSPLIKTMLHRIKFKQGTLDSFILSQLLAKQLSKLYKDKETNLQLPQIILPTPLALPRLMRRGFNQSAGIAQQLGKELGVPINYRLLKRVLNTRPQTGRTRSERKRALAHAFKVTGKISFKHVALVDDVMTSQATLRAQAHCLRNAGVESVQAWILARTPRQKARISPP